MKHQILLSAAVMWAAIPAAIGTAQCLYFPVGYLGGTGWKFGYLRFQKPASQWNAVASGDGRVSFLQSATPGLASRTVENEGWRSKCGCYLYLLDSP